MSETRSTHVVHTKKCLNCSSSITRAMSYCSSCGAKQIENRLTTRNLLEEFSSSFFNLENSFFKTFIALFTKPEDVIGGYIKGMRKRYISAVGYFGISLTVTGIYVFFFNNFFLEDLFNSVEISGETGDKRTVEITKNVLQIATNYSALLKFCTIPVLAALSRLVFITNKKYNYLEHLIIFLYLYSQYSIITSILSLITAPFFTLNLVIASSTQLLLLFYAGYVFKRLYVIDWGEVILKALLYLLIAAFLIAIISIAAGIIAYKLGLLDSFVKANTN